jgi:hypothetical protein
MACGATPAVLALAKVENRRLGATPTCFGKSYLTGLWESYARHSPTNAKIEAGSPRSGPLSQACNRGVDIGAVLPVASLNRRTELSVNDRLYNTLRISLLVLLLLMLGPLLLLGTFASLTGYQSAQPGNIAGLVLSLALAIFVAVDIFLTVAIVRAIVRHFRSPQAPLVAEPNPAAAAQSIRMLAVAIAAQIFFGALNSIFALANSRSTFHSPPRNFAAWSYLLVSFVPAHLPFLLLIPCLLRKPGSRSFSFAIAIPCILALPNLLLGLGAGGGTLTSLATGALNFAILFLAWRATRATGIRPGLDSILITAVITFFYFSVIRFMLPFVARFPSS